MRVPVPPVHTPLRARDLLAGLRGALRDTGAGARVGAWLGRQFHADSVVLTDRGTSALRLAVRVAVERLPGAILLPAYCCYDLVTAVNGAGVPYRFYDLDPYTLGPNWDSLARSIDGASAVVVAHLYGHPIGVDRARTLCRASGALLIEDAAQGRGGSWGERELGSHGDLSVLSFGRGKGLPGGGGGALLARGERTPDIVGLERELGPSPVEWSVLARSGAQWALARRYWYGLPRALPFLGLGETTYHDPWPPKSASRTSLALLESARALVEEEDHRRREVGDRLLAAAQAHGVTIPAVAAGGSRGFLRFPILASDRSDLPPGSMRGYPRTLPSLESSRAPLDGSGFPGAEQLVRQVVTLPSHGLLTSSDIEGLLRWFESETSSSPSHPPTQSA